MKKQKLTLVKTRLILTILLLCSLSLRAQEGVLSFSPIGLNNNYSFSLGLKEKNLVLYIGASNLNSEIKFSETGNYIALNRNGQRDTLYAYSEEENIQTNLFFINIGFKYIIESEDKKTKPYFASQIIIPINKRDAFTENISTIALSYAANYLHSISFEFFFGAEYFFNSSLSLSGEFGVRYIQIYVPKEARGVYSYTTADNNTYFREISSSKLTNKSNPVFSRLSLNFYF
jgi:hypothetical protein